MRGKKTQWVLILLVLILVAIVADVAVQLLVRERPKAPSDCLTIPTEFALDYPDCAEKLIRAANITNVHIVSIETLEGESGVFETVQPKD